MHTSRALVLTTTITCPACGHRETETMPTNACVYFYACRRCQVIVRPTAGNCCVFCSHADARCPPAQSGDGCGERCPE